MDGEGAFPEVDIFDTKPGGFAATEPRKDEELKVVSCDICVFLIAFAQCIQCFKPCCQVSIANFPPGAFLLDSRDASG